MSDCKYHCNSIQSAFQVYRVLPSFPSRRSSDLFKAAISNAIQSARSVGQPGVRLGGSGLALGPPRVFPAMVTPARDRKSTRLNSSHTVISYAAFSLKKKHYLLT